jgi:putative transposase
LVHISQIAAGAFVLDILVQTRRNATAAKRFIHRLITQFGEPRVMITGKLCSYVKPIKTLAPDADHCAHKGLNNAIEGSHRPTRKREKIFARFKSHRQTQRLLSAHDQTNLIFRPAGFNAPQTHIAMPEMTRSASGQNTPSR